MIGVRRKKRLNRLLGGCDESVLLLMERFPGRALIAAAFISASKCIKVMVS